MFLLSTMKITFIIVGVLLGLILLILIARSVNKNDDENEKDNSSVKKTVKKKKKTKVSLEPKYQGKYVIECENNSYRFKLLASNGQSLITSELYTTEKGCRSGIETLKKNIEESSVKVESDKHDIYYFIVLSKQNRILCQSANYTSKDQAIKASESFKKFASSDNIIFDDESINSKTEIIDVSFELKDKGKIEIVKDNEQFYYILKASNGVKLAVSQNYKSYTTVKEAVNRFKEEVYTGEFILCKDKNSNYQFKLYNSNKRLIIVGEVYTTKAQVTSNVSSIKAFTKNAIIIESNIIS